MNATIFRDLLDLRYSGRIDVDPSDGLCWTIHQPSRERRPVVREHLDHYLEEGLVAPIEDGRAFVITAAGRELLAQYDTFEQRDEREEAFENLMAQLRAPEPTHTALGGVVMEGAFWTDWLDGTQEQAPSDAYLVLALPFEGLLAFRRLALQALPELRETFGFRGVHFRLPARLVPRNDLGGDIYDGVVEENPFWYADGDQMCDDFDRLFERPIVWADAELGDERLTVTMEVPDQDWDTGFWWKLRARATLPVAELVEAINAQADELP